MTSQILEKIMWLLHRLKAMSLSELFFRCRFALLKRFWKFNLKLSRFEFTESFYPSLPTLQKIQISNPDSEESDTIISEAEKYLEHRWCFFQFEWVKESSINWHKDIGSGKISPKIFSFDINHRHEEVTGNCKNIWEKNRHHHLTILALAYCLTKNEKYADEVRLQILDWIRNNPYLVGINWTHPLESGIRLISWVWCERLLRGSPSHLALFGKSSPVWPCIYQHQVFISNTYSCGSSANNHLIGEMAGLYIASTAWPFFQQSKAWESISRKSLEKEICRQTFASGINREQAFSYQIFVIEFFLLALIEANRSNHPFSSEYSEYLTRMITAIPLLTDAGGNLPRYGDSDEGMAINLQPSSAPRDQWIYQVSHKFLGAEVPHLEKNIIASQVFGYTRKSMPEYRPVSQGSTAWCDAGIFLLATGRNTPNEVYLLADAGPHGFLDISAHGHADALSFSLSIGGIPIFIDPGTFSYHTDKNWRNYFSGTHAHNSIVIGNYSQSKNSGPFLWTRTARTSLIEWRPDPDGGKLTASHDGYENIGVIHRRTYELKGSLIHIEDTLSGSGEHDIQILFHCHPECAVKVNEENSLSVRRGKAELNVRLSPQLQVSLVEGGAPFGWFSPKFGIKIPATTIIGFTRSRLPLRLITEINANF